MFDRVLGAIAQLVEHLHGMQGVRSSSLLGSTEFSKLLTGFLAGGQFFVLSGDDQLKQPLDINQMQSVPSVS